jgi:hypothetical protein
MTLDYDTVETAIKARNGAFQLAARFSVPIRLLREVLMSKRAKTISKPWFVRRSRDKLRRYLFTDGAASGIQVG